MKTRLAVAGSFLALFVLQACLVVLPAQRDARPLTWDPSVHMRSAWKYRADVAAGRWEGLLHPPHTPGHPPYPPLTHVVMAAGVALSDALGLDVEDGAVLANLFFLMLLAWAAYLLASDWWGETAGVAAAFLTSLLPPLTAAAPQLLVDVALTAWVAMAYAAWMRSRRFFLWGWTVGLGLVFAAGMLSKWTFFLYVLPIMAAAAWDMARSTEKGVRWRIAAAALAAALPFALWLLPNLVNVFAKVSRAAGLGAQEGDPTRGLDALFYYLGSFKNGLGWLGLAAAVAGGVWAGLRHPLNGVTLAAWLSSSYAVWTMVSNKDPRYMYPALPALSLAAASLPFRLPVLLAALLAGSAGWACLSSKFRAPAWPLGAVAAQAAAARREPQGPPSVFTLISNHDYLNGNNFLWSVERDGLDGKLIVRSRSSGLGEFTEFVLVKTGDLGPVRSIVGHEKAREEALRPDGWFQRYFEKKSVWPFPDGSEGILFQRLPAGSAPAVRMDPAAALPRLVPGAEAEGLSARCGEDPMLEGEGDCVLRAAVIRMKGLVLKDVALDLGGLRLAADDEGRPRLLDLRRIEAKSLRLSGEDAARFLAARVKPLSKAEVRFLAGNEVEVKGRLKGLPVKARAKVSYDGAADVVRAEILSFRLLGAPLPVRRSAEISLKPKRGWPFLVELSGLKTDPSSNSLEVSP